MMEFVRLETHRLLTLTVIVCLLFPDLSFCYSLEGFSLLRFRDRVVNDPFGALLNWKDDHSVPNPCSWFGVECSNGHVVSLNIAQTGIKSPRKLLQAIGNDQNRVAPVPGRSSPFPSPTSPSPSPLPPAGAPSSSPSPSPSPSLSPSPSSQTFPIPNRPSALAPTTTTEPPPSRLPPPSRPPPPASNSSSLNTGVIIGVAIGGSALIGIAALLLWRCNKVATVRPWATGLSGQLQKAFVTGVPKLKRSELEAACEDFSNVIGSTSFGTVYKGTLSSGVEIAVASVAAPSAKDWSKHLESLFRKRIDMLSKVNHKNFVNLLGFCEEEEPFTRMIAFEYAPNGTLYEHLHIQESEHLDWGMRMRIAMGMAYCLDYMHQLTPPACHKNLNSSSVNLTEDYAAKISDLGLCNDSSTAPTEQTPENTVYSFGVILFEMITGQIPYAGSEAVDDWVIDFLKTGKPMINLVDPTLDAFDADQLEAVGNLIRSCVISEPTRMPKMREVTSRLKEITRIAQDGATPKISPLWWAELEILSTEAT
ncbi:hypothetical protein L1987_25133 [Smallanthus sonchifolius]|uniref:Uncharacterized protein n=1 Tax=Smallanthus sonchifolius TaxID=185202 RepID=A0ACB9INQ4_9ASTR|nr:hypothetical protein L1987_25133 [Smallanthus sonchifolius]